MKIFRFNKQIRFVAFVLIVAGIFAYLSAKWQAFNQSAQQTGNSVVLVRTTPARTATTASGTPATADHSGASGDYFVETRMARERARSQESDTLKSIVDDPSASVEARNKAQEALLDLATRVEREAEIEALLKAKDYAEAVVFLHDQSAIVVLRAKRLAPTDVARIGDIVTRVGHVPVEAVNIVTRP